MPLDPVSTLHPVTGAIRTVTSTLLAETYLCPLPAPFEDGAAIREARQAPWAKSLEAAPEATGLAVSRGLRDLIDAAPALDPASVEVERLPEGRARRHLAALRDLWRDIGGVPEALFPLVHALGCNAGDALEPLPLMASADATGATVVDRQTMALLARHHGSVERPDAFPGLGPAGTGPLRAFQRGEICADPYPLRVTTLRDPQEELRFAAARAQRLLDDGTVASADEIGLLMPDDSAWHLDAEAIFAAVGLHLGGLPGPATRDRAAEAVHLVLTVLNKPAPGMAMVALDALGFETREPELRKLLGRAPHSHADLSRTLHAIANHLPTAAAHALRAQAGRADEAPVDWDGLIAATRPGSVADAPTTATKDAVSVFTEGATPWREVRHLLAIGFAGDRFPSVSGSGSFWLEHEIDQIADRCGIALPGRSRSLQLAYARLNRQLSAATEGVEITLPSRDRAGDRLSPAAALDMLAHRLGRTSGDLIAPLARHADDWPCASHAVTSRPGTDRPRAPGARTIDLKRDLTGLRVRDGEVLPQSPSRLETLLVSPLAWLFGELGVAEAGWSPDALDGLVRGSLMHKVLETLFPEGPPPAPDLVADAVPQAVDDAIAADRDLRFLGATAWAVERKHLIGDLQRAARRWAEILNETGTTIHATEIYLRGEASGLPLHGKADVVLKLESGGLLVVDYKSGSSGKRIKRMENGWDMQAQLYGDMLTGSDLTTGSNAISVGYLNLADMIAVTGGTLAPAAFGPLDGDTSAEARAKMGATVSDLRKGIVHLNGTSDAKAFEKIGVATYALDHPLVGAFLWEDEE